VPATRQPALPQTGQGRREVDDCNRHRALL
jgi:hypothetical protein